MSDYNLNHLKQLEDEAVYILRETASQFNNAVLMFSGGKDSVVLAHLAAKAFYPDILPFKLLHIDTGHNFEETIAFRDEYVESLGADLIVARVQDTIDLGRAKDAPSRNAIQSVTLLDVIDDLNIDAAIGGGRRDEEKARAKERIFSIRDDWGTWDPKNQRPELWNIYNGRINEGEHMRVFPISNWTELDVWNYIKQECIELPSLYFAHKRPVFNDGGVLRAYTVNDLNVPPDDVTELYVRFRTIGDTTCTGAIESTATTIDDVIKEVESSRITERGSRVDDKTSDTAMEDRKKNGYF